MRMAKPSIVVVETYSAMSLLVDEVLTSEGYLVRLWPDGASAAAFIRQEQPDLVILDLWLDQRGDGLPILVQLCGDGATRHIPLIVFVDDPNSLPLERVLPAAERLEVLEKPFALEAFVAKVGHMLDPATARSMAGRAEASSIEAALGGG